MLPLTAGHVTNDNFCTGKIEEKMISSDSDYQPTNEGRLEYYQLMLSLD